MSSNLHHVLLQTDMSHPSITKSAGSMMKLYDSAASMAVNEWRNTLQVCRDEQLLPLLYVANEVLQNSKRNRGNLFLEAFSAILGSSLEYICSRQPHVVEKVRRTTKIWGDRRVFSVRFVSELLKRLEPFRGGGTSIPNNSVSTTGGSEENVSNTAASVDENTKAGDSPSGRFSPEMGVSTAPVPTEVIHPSPKQSRAVTADDLMRLSEDEDDDSTGSAFDNEGQLDIQIDPNQLEGPGENNDNKNSKSGENGMGSPLTLKKRRRSSKMGLAASAGGTKRKRKSQILSTQALQDLITQLTSVQQSLDRSLTLVSAIPAKVDEGTSAADLVGEELAEAFGRNQSHLKLLHQERANIYKFAQQKFQFQLDAERFVGWCQTCLAQDDEDLNLADDAEQALLELQTIHGPAQALKRARQAKQLEAQRQQEIAMQLQQEEEERRQLLAAAMAKQDEAKPGMVWDKRRQEYVYLNTDESWRD